MPEAERLPQVEREEDRARDEGDEARDESDAGRALVARVARETKERAERVATPGDAAEEEVREDPPLPLWGRDEVLGGRHQCAFVELFALLPFIRPLRKARRPAKSPTTAVATPPM